MRVLARCQPRLAVSSRACTELGAEPLAGLAPLSPPALQPSLLSTWRPARACWGPPTLVGGRAGRAVRSAPHPSSCPPLADASASKLPADRAALIFHTLAHTLTYPFMHYPTRHPHMQRCLPSSRCRSRPRAGPFRSGASSSCWRAGARCTSCRTPGMMPTASRWVGWACSGQASVWPAPCLHSGSCPHAHPRRLLRAGALRQRHGRQLDCCLGRLHGLAVCVCTPDARRHVARLCAHIHRVPGHGARAAAAVQVGGRASGRGAWGTARRRLCVLPWPRAARACALRCASPASSHARSQLGALPTHSCAALPPCPALPLPCPALARAAA